MHADCLSMMGHPMVKTPNLDALASRGVYANRMFTCSAICSPSRTSFVTGMYLRSHGLFGNNAPMTHPFQSLPGQLRRNGYSTALIGKSHFPASIEREFETCVTIKKYEAEMRSIGFDYKAVDQTTNKNFQSMCSPIPEELQNEVWTANHTISFLQKQRDNTKPFFLWCSFDRPHCPHTPPASFDDLYNPEDVPVDWDSYQAFEDSLLQSRPMIESFWSLGSVKHDVSIFQKAVCRYFALITFIDREIGRILATLEECDLAEDTLVIFTSDHGDFAGQFGQLGKNLPAYDPLIRIPFIYYDPTREGDGGRCIERLLQSVDVMPTILDRLGVETPATVQGESFIRGLDGFPETPRRYAFVETAMEKTIRSKDWKLTFFARHPDRGQLFRMGPKPDEVTNLWNDPAYRDVQEELLTELCSWMVRCEQHTGICFQWEEYISTRWLEYLKNRKGSRSNAEDFRDTISPEQDFARSVTC